MAAHRPEWKTYCKYVLLQLPGLALTVLVLLLLDHWLQFSGLLFWGIVVAWVAKDAILFPFVWRAYESENPAKGQDLIGKTAVAEEFLAPAGYVRVGAELWSARLEEVERVPAGTKLVVTAMHGLTLTVRPAPSAPGPPAERSG